LRPSSRRGSASITLAAGSRRGGVPFFRRLQGAATG
jgi:hypothetical protein